MDITPLSEFTPEELAIIEPVKIGPTWMKDPTTNKWILPERTLGWQIAGWCAEWLKAEDGGPWRFTKEQLRFILWWYAMDANGRFIYRKGVLQRMKGWGKDPLLAVMCLVELVGPSRPDVIAFGIPRLNDAGEIVGIPHPQAYVQVSAVNQAQTTNTMDLIPSLMSDEFIAHYKIKPGAEIIRAHGGKQKLVAVTSSFRALEGKRTTFTLLNETHHWIAGNKGIQMYETIDGNATKKDSRYLAITNAYLPGEDSVAEKMRDSWEKIQEGLTLDIGFLYDSLEAHSKAPLSGPMLPHILNRVRGDAKWLRIETIMQSINDTTLAQSRSRRMWLNQIVAEEEALYGPESWDYLADHDEMLAPREKIVLGFDGGKTDDSTALVALRCHDMFASLLLIEEKPDGPRGDGWEVDREKVNRAVQDAFRTYEVVGFYADVALWESYISDWAEEYGEQLLVKAPGKDAISWDMRSSLQRVTRAHERLVQAIFDGKIKHDGNRTLRRHLLNVRRRDNNYGTSFGKETKDSPRKVDAYAALMLAHEALNDYRTGKASQPKRERTGRGYFL